VGVRGALASLSRRHNNKKVKVDGLFIELVSASEARYKMASLCTQIDDKHWVRVIRGAKNAK
jgi:hypothetical protein